MMRISEKMDSRKLCRLCMCMSSTTYHLFKSRESFDRQLLYKLKKCIPLHIKKNDTLPKRICENCIAKTEEFYEFINQCVNTESILKNFCRTSRVSDQSKCQGKLILGESLRGSCNDNFVDPKKNNFSNPLLKRTKLSMINCVQSGSTQIDNDLSDRYEDVCKYDAQPVTKATNEINSNEYNYTIANNSIQPIQTDLFKDVNVSGDVQLIYSSPDIFSLNEEDTEMNTNSVNNMIVKPDINFQFNKSDNDQDSESDLDDSISKVFDSKYIKRILSIDGVSTSCSACGKVLDNEEEIGMHSHTCEAINNKNIQNLLGTTAYIEPPRFSSNVCEKKFKGKDHLIHLHKCPLRRAHSCKSCTKSFNKKKNLIRHTLIHTGRRFYKCGMCSKHFSTKNNLNKHQTKHRVSRLFVCQTCGRSFTKKYYVKHLKTHNDVEHI